MNLIVIAFLVLFVLAMATVVAAGWVAQRFGPAIAVRIASLQRPTAKKKGFA